MAALRHLAFVVLLLVCLAPPAHGGKGSQSCAKLIGDPLCESCHVHPKTRRKECKRCAPHQTDDDSAMEAVKYPVYKDSKGKCRKCSNCPASEGWATCTTKGKCNTCQSGFVRKGGKCEKRPCKNLVNCLVAPCQVNNTCALDEVCVDDYCGGCNTRCIKKPKLCSMMQCLVSPCQANPCGEGLTCVEDYCSGCNYRCVATPCKDLVQCTVSPCNANPCKAGETCVEDYCGGCNYYCAEPKV